MCSLCGGLPVHPADRQASISRDLRRDSQYESALQEDGAQANRTDVPENRLEWTSAGVFPEQYSPDLLGSILSGISMPALSGFLLRCDASLFDCVTRRIRRSFIDLPAQLISRSGDGQAYPIFLGITLLLRSYRWSEVLLSFVLAYKALKKSVRRARPADVLPGIALIEPPDLFSFPSGHSAAAFVAAFLPVIG